MEAGETLRRLPHAGGLADHEPEAVDRARGAQANARASAHNRSQRRRREVTFRDSAGASFTLRCLPPPPGQEFSVKPPD